MADTPPLPSIAGLPAVPGAVSGQMMAPVLSPTVFGGYPPNDPRYGQMSGTGGSVDAAALSGPNAILQGQLAGSQVDVNAARTGANTGAAQIAGGAAQVASGQQGVNVADFAALVQRKAVDENIMARWGTNPGNPSELYATMAAGIQNDEKVILDRRGQINQKLAQPFLDNPIQWLINQITVPFDLDEVHSLVAGQNQKLEVLNKLRDATKEEITLNASTAYSTDSMKLAALNNLAAGQATEKAGQANLQAAGTMIGVSTASTNIGNTGFHGDSTVARFGFEYNEAAQTRQLRLRNDAREQGTWEVSHAVALINKSNLDAEQVLRNQSNDLRARVNELNEKEKELRKSGDMTAAQEIAQTRIGYEKQIEDNTRIASIPDPTRRNAEAQRVANEGVAAAIKSMDQKLAAVSAITGIKFGNYAEFERMEDGPTKNAIKALLNNPDITNNFQWSSVGPAQAIKLVNDLKIVMPTAGQELTRKQLTVLRETALTALGPTAKTLYTPEQLEIKLNEQMLKALGVQAANIQPTGGMYSLPSLQENLNLPGIAGTKIAALLSPMATSTATGDNSYPTKADDIVARLGVEIKDGRMQPKEAAALMSEFYKVAVRQLDATKGYRVLALPSPMEKMEYKTALPSNSYSSYSPVIGNVMNPSFLENYFTRLKTSQMLAPAIGADRGIQ